MGIHDQGSAAPRAVWDRDQRAKRKADLIAELGTDDNVAVYRLQERLQAIDQIITNNYVAADGMRMAPDDIRTKQSEIVAELARLRGHL